MKINIDSEVSGDVYTWKYEGNEEEEPIRMSLTMVVPLLVPSETHNSTP
jgi:hypothetical protein